MIMNLIFVYVSELFIYCNWQVENCFALRELFGTGAYGTVVSALWQPTRVATTQLVAVKKIENVFENGITARRTLREIILLRLLRHHENVRQASMYMYIDRFI